jgi:uncharacterized protein (UPF0264 family)
MRLLVSVRSPAEAHAALAGGAEIIDAKEPSRGSLGTVSEAVLRKIAAVVPADRPLSVALGDLTTSSAVAAALDRVRRAVGEREPLYLKLGFAGVSPADAIVLGQAAVDAAGAMRGARVILVAYADHEAAGAPSPDEVVRIADLTCAAGILLDTYRKDGRSLLDHIDDGALRAWTARAAGRGRLVALAGSLHPDALHRLDELAADIIGVRTAACTGGRTGAVAAARVVALKARLGCSRAATTTGVSA